MSYTVPFDVPKLSFDEAYAQVRSALRFGIDPTLDTTVELLSELGDPDLAFSSLQVAGTNGKTSTARFAAAILRGQGQRTALYTSPELVSYTERMEVDGSPISSEAFARGVSAVLVAIERINRYRRESDLASLQVTEFELLTVAACVVFAEAGVESCVFEVGMGGRWDATSAVRSIRSVAVTGIDLDHMHILGDTLEAIAAEKAAVIKSGRSCVLGAGSAVTEGVQAVLLDQCVLQHVSPVLVLPIDPRDAPAELLATWKDSDALPRVRYRIVHRPEGLAGPLEISVETPHRYYDKLSLRKPAYQAANVACAIAMVEGFVGGPLEPSCVRQAIATCPTPGRFEVVREHPLALIDACHNPQSVLAFLTAVRDAIPCVSDRPVLLAAALADKDAERMASLLAPEFPKVVVCQTASPRALKAGELAKLFRAAGAEPEAICGCVSDALALLEHTPFVACGSITLAGEVSALMASDNRYG